MMILSFLIKLKAVVFTIPCCMEEQFRKELSNIGISKSFIYPDATHYAEDIRGKNRLMAEKQILINHEEIES